MTTTEKRKHCYGCRDDFYNRNDMGLNMKSGSPECWSLPGAKLVWKKEVHIDQRPPWNQKARRFLDCFHRERHVYVDPKQTR